MIWADTQRLLMQTALADVDAELKKLVFIPAQATEMHKGDNSNNRALPTFLVVKDQNFKHI